MAILFQHLTLIESAMKLNELFKYLLVLVTAIAVGSLLSACAGNTGFSTSNLSAGSIQEYQAVRKPAVGQQWVYNVRDLYNNNVIDTITESVVSVSPVIEIKRESKKHGVLVSEIQSTAGLVLRDPYWNPTVTYVKPMPLWPQTNDQTQTFSSSYKTGEDEVSTYSWSSTIKFVGAETLGLDGKQFNTLKSIDSIAFKSQDFSRAESTRRSTIWVTPNIGRWVVRITEGSYFDAGSAGMGNDRRESMLQYELVSYK